MIDHTADQVASTCSNSDAPIATIAIDARSAAKSISTENNDIPTSTACKPSTP